MRMAYIPFLVILPVILMDEPYQFLYFRYVRGEVAILFLFIMLTIPLNRAAPQTLLYV